MERFYKDHRVLKLSMISHLGLLKKTSIPGASYLSLPELKDCTKTAARLLVSLMMEYRERCFMLVHTCVWSQVTINSCYIEPPYVLFSKVAQKRKTHFKNCTIIRHLRQLSLSQFNISYRLFTRCIFIVWIHIYSSVVNHCGWWRKHR